jgi:hypothetical protein
LWPEYWLRIPNPPESAIYFPACRQWKWNAVLLGYWLDFEPIEVCQVA